MEWHYIIVYLNREKEWQDQKIATMCINGVAHYDAGEQKTTWNETGITIFSI